MDNYPVHYCESCGQQWVLSHDCPKAKARPQGNVTDMQVQIIARVFPDQPELERLRADNAALRERVAVLERVREAAKLYREFCFANGKLTVAELDAALDAAKDGA